MAQQANILYRSNDGVVAGVCACFARRWNVDIGVLRFAVIALTLATCGAFALVYAALWLILPSQEQVRRTVDVSPESVASDTYGVRDGVDKKTAKTREDYAHMPPKSPEDTIAAMKAKTAHAGEGSSTHVVVALVLGIVVVVAGMAFVISSVVPIFSPLQFWPLIVIALGIVLMVIPQTGGYRIQNFMVGFFLCCLGAVLLMSTTCVYVVHSGRWFAQGWPLLAIAAGCLLLWHGTRLNGFALCAMVLVVAFCVVGIAFCSDAGPALSVITQQPFTKGLPMSGGC